MPNPTKASQQQLLTADQFEQAVQAIPDIGKNPVSGFSISKIVTIFEKTVAFS